MNWIITKTQPIVTALSQIFTTNQIAEKLSDRQQSLRSLGLLVDDMDSEQTPLERIRKRINLIFGI
ncbi:MULTISPECIES: hypothetical protein [unclassified Coleofasciculus]|uniref:hypothetical protein n=1 Tax=unclassified Coleofasciculus TaxID=2692782 RepID=UPI001883017E|nr:MULTISPECIES: hypothetical protein [unclassified Coleofasciculus]MBE9128392.1 hypothetical protein [Coleofasciculus sp. LEGE 07081]MBE9147912.1 hypothetical protein [Coleofasciculus sp. LEGE 07092]